MNTAVPGSSPAAAPVVALTSRTRPAPAHPDLLAMLAPGGFAWLHDGGGIVTAGVAARVPVEPGVAIDTASAEVDALLAGIEVEDPLRLPGTGPLAVGALPFDPGGGAELVVPALVIGQTADGRAWVTEIEPVQETAVLPHDPVDPPSRFVVDSGQAQEQWTAAVGKAVRMIAGGTLTKVVLAREVVIEADRPFHIAGAARRLLQADPSCFVYACGSLVGASPELLVRRRGGKVMSRPMAGSCRRGATIADDDSLAAALASSPKELAEHRMVVDAVRDGLEAVCDKVIAGAGPEVVRLATVAHLATTVVGQLQPPWPSALALARRLHPTPAVAGVPRQQAIEAIARLEGFNRGLYAGPVGWVDSRGDGDWVVALRCASIDGTRARLAAGAGIVAHSDAEAEWAETQAKLEPMLRALVRP